MPAPPPCPVCGLRKIRYPTKADAKTESRRWASRPGRTRRTRQYPCGDFFHNTGADAETTAWYRVNVDRKREPA